MVWVDMEHKLKKKLQGDAEQLKLQIEINFLSLYLNSHKGALMTDPKIKTASALSYFPFEILRALEKDKLIKPVYDVPVVKITSRGEKLGELLKKKYLKF